MNGHGPHNTLWEKFWWSRPISTQEHINMQNRQLFTNWSATSSHGKTSTAPCTQRTSPIYLSTESGRAKSMVKKKLTPWVLWRTRTATRRRVMTKTRTRSSSSVKSGYLTRSQYQMSLLHKIFRQQSWWLQERRTMLTCGTYNHGITYLSLKRLSSSWLTILWIY